MLEFLVIKAVITFQKKTMKKELISRKCLKRVNYINSKKKWLIINHWGISSGRCQLFLSRNVKLKKVHRNSQPFTKRIHHPTWKTFQTANTDRWTSQLTILTPRSSLWVRETSSRMFLFLIFQFINNVDILI
jgi:hypothetical protein